MGEGSSLWRQWAALLLKSLAALVAFAGFVAALGGWAIMSFYPDDRPNSWLQNATPFLVYVLPTWICAAGLVAAAGRVDRRPHRPRHS